MTDDERRAEIEAVAWALQKRFGSRTDWNVKVAEEAITVLDGIRDARGDDTPVWVSPLAEAEHDEAARSPDEDHEGRRRKKPLRVATEDQPAALAMWDAWDRYHRAVLAARSPQGIADDDRRAEIEAVVRELKHNDECGPGPVSDAEYQADAEAIITVLHRVRDARGDDEAAGDRPCDGSASCPAMTHTEGCFAGPGWREIEAARSPQDYEMRSDA
jgi:hypothetical protein